MGNPVNKEDSSQGQVVCPPGKQKCGICSRFVDANPRYPNLVCYNCQDESPPVNVNNQNVEFGNIDASGGFKSVVNGVSGEDHICYIKDVRCYANEARFGGIVIIPYPEKNE